jgi:hypothetical protein
VITREEFEEAWGHYIGYDVANLPLLPEHMAQQINRVAVHSSQKEAPNPSLTPRGLAKQKSMNPGVEVCMDAGDARTGKQLWQFLKIRLKVLASFQARDLPPRHISRLISAYHSAHAAAHLGQHQQPVHPRQLGQGGGPAAARRDGPGYSLHGAH